jgi:hypothetical protein
MTQDTEYISLVPLQRVLMSMYVVQQTSIVLWLIGVTNKEKPRKGEGVS